MCLKVLNIKMIHAWMCVDYITLANNVDSSGFDYFSLLKVFFNLYLIYV